MLKEYTEPGLNSVKESLFQICQESGILIGENIEDYYHDDLIESGIIDSMGVVCLQDQIENRFNVTISLDQFVAELHTLAKLVDFLETGSADQVPA